MRFDLIHSMKYLFPIAKDDYGNDLWLVFVNTKNKNGWCRHCGYFVMSKNKEEHGYVEEAYWKTKEKELIKIEKDGFMIEEYNERQHRLEDKEPNLVTRFYIRKDL